MTTPRSQVTTPPANWPLEKHIDTDGTLAADSDARVPSQRAVRKFVQGRQAFAVNGLYFNTDGVNPATVLGYGTWVLFASGTTLVGFKTGDPDFGVAGATVGNKTTPAMSHSGTAVATHANHTHTVVQSANAATPHLVAVDLAAGVSAAAVTDGVSATLTHSVTQPADHPSMSVIQPSTVVYFWVRTA